MKPKKHCTSLPRIGTARRTERTEPCEQKRVVLTGRGGWEESTDLLLGARGRATSRKKSGPSSKRA